MCGYCMHCALGVGCMTKKPTFICISNRDECLNFSLLREDEDDSSTAVIICSVQIYTSTLS